LASESSRAPQSNPDAVISCIVVVPELELQTIPERKELETTRPRLEHETTELNAPHGNDGSTGMSLK
jgi:hypothetical protein